MKNNKAIVVFCHSRAELLDKCLFSLTKASGINFWNINLVHQQEYASVEKVIRKHRSFINNLIVTKPNFEFPLGNINYNRIVGTKFGFEILGVEYLLGVEEDNVLSVDSLDFIDYIYTKYEHDSDFRGINLSSIEHGKSISKSTFSLLRSGLHGSAGVLTSRSWDSIRQRKLLEFDLADEKSAWDAKIEFYLKSGFMVTPNLSRNLDLGYGGTFAPKDKNDPYFYGIQKSWYRGISKQKINYKHVQIVHHIRNDAVAYRKVHQIFYLLRRNDLMYKIFSGFRVFKIIKKFLIPN